MATSNPFDFMKLRCPPVGPGRSSSQDLPTSDHHPPHHRLNHTLESASTEHSCLDNSALRPNQSPNAVNDEQLYGNRHSSTSGYTNNITSITSGNNNGNERLFCKDGTNAALFSDNKSHVTNIETENGLGNEYFRNNVSGTKSSDNKSKNTTRASNNTNKNLNKQPLTSSPIPQLTRMESLPPQEQQEQPQHEVLKYRCRTTYTREQINILEIEFNKYNYVSRRRKCQLAQEFNLQESSIKIWFQNRRMKEKREKKAVAWPYTDPNFTACIQHASQHGIIPHYFPTATALSAFLYGRYSPYPLSRPSPLNLLHTWYITPEQHLPKLARPVPQLVQPESHLALPVPMLARPVPQLVRMVPQLPRPVPQLDQIVP